MSSTDQRSPVHQYALAFAGGIAGLMLGWAVLDRVEWIKPLFDAIGASWAVVYIAPCGVGAVAGAVWGERLSSKSKRMTAEGKP